MCVSIGGINAAVQRSRAAAAKLVDQEMAAKIEAKAREVEKEADWDTADYLSSELEDLAEEALLAQSDQQAVDDLIADTVRLAREPVAPVEPTVHAEVEAEAERSRRKAMLYA